MPGKCEHGLTTKECLVCASAKYGLAPERFRDPIAKIERLRAHLDDALFVLGMVDKNNRIDAGEKGKAWSGRFVIEEVRRVLAGTPAPGGAGLTQCDMHEDESY
ncbi:MAG: hypothetical protein RLZZ373_2626 [Pseudomonadota bacterium]|jgi:hypothetical protein